MFWAEVDERSSDPDVARFWVERTVRSPVYCVPSSPGVNESVEQKPSDEEMSSVRPSPDLYNVLVGRRNAIQVISEENLPCQIGKRSTV